MRLRVKVELNATLRIRKCAFLGPVILDQPIADLITDAGAAVRERFELIHVLQLDVVDALLLFLVLVSPVQPLRERIPADIEDRANKCARRNDRHPIDACTAAGILSPRFFARLMQSDAFASIAGANYNQKTRTRVTMRVCGG